MCGRRWANPQRCLPASWLMPRSGEKREGKDRAVPWGGLDGECDLRNDFVSGKGCSTEGRVQLSNIHFHFVPFQTRTLSVVPAAGCAPEDGFLGWHIPLDASWDTNGMHCFNTIRHKRSIFLKENVFNLWVESCEGNKKPKLNSQ